MREWLIAFLMISLCFATTTVAQEEESDPFESAGLSLIALRNDSLDSNQDGITDAIRVVYHLRAKHLQYRLDLLTSELLDQTSHLHQSLDNPTYPLQNFLL